MQRIVGFLPLSVFMWVMISVFITGYSLAGGVPPCVPDGKLEQSISPEAELTDFICFYKNYEGADVLHFNVAIKNVSDTPQRFRIHIFLDNGKAVGGLIPRTTKDGLVEPGQSASFEYPVTGMTAKPKEIVLNISTVVP